MRDLFVLALIAGAVYLGLRQMGCVSTGENPPAEAASADADRSAEPASSGEESAEAAAGEAAPRGAAAEARALVDAELDALLRDDAIEDPEGLRAATERAGDVGALATALLDARAGDKKRRWLGLSRVLTLASDRVEPRAGFLGRIERAARDALYLPGESVSQAVRPGDSLDRLRKRFRAEDGVVVAVGTLRWLNGISGDLIHPGDELRAPRAPVTLRASKTGFWIRVQIGDGILREFRIGIGRDDKTPAASFVLKAPLEKPPWNDPVTGKRYHFGDPEYAIGTRWIGFEPNGPHRGLGIHGTNEPDSIGHAASLGCIRLRNEDVEVLAELVAPGMTIVIRE